jgi:uncharacterized protein (DUF305 family)
MLNSMPQFLILKYLYIIHLKANEQSPFNSAGYLNLLSHLKQKHSFMKYCLSLFMILFMCFIAACNNSSNNSTTDTTSTASTTDGNDTGTSPNMSMQDTANSGNSLMKANENMMAQMHSMQMTGDFDIDFANMMIQHHQGGIDMAQVETSQGKDDKMKAKAQEIITKQKEEQQQLRDFVQGYKPSGMKHGEGELQKSMQAMMDKMKSMQMSGNVDKDFATMMASHHQDGISMAKMELENGMSDKLKQMARKSIDDQQKDINEFKAWLSSNK